MADDISDLRSAIRDAIVHLCAYTETPFFNPFGTVPLPELALRMSKGQERYIVATGSYALCEWQPGDSVRLVILSKATQSTMWALIAEKLGVKIQNPNATIIELSAPDLAMTTTWQPSALTQFKTLSHKNKGDCKFYLHYCRFPAMFDSTTAVRFPSHHPSEFNPAPAQIASLSLVLDSQIIAGMIDPPISPPTNQCRLQQFREEYRSLRRWAKEHGVLSGKLGFLNSECLISLVHKAVQVSESAESATLRSDPSTPDSIVGALETLVVTETEQASIHPTTAAAKQLQGPMKQLQASLKSHTVRKEIRFTKIEITSPTDRLVSGEIRPTNAIAIQAALQNDETLGAFMQGYKHYMKIHFTTWETSTTRVEHYYSTAIPQFINRVISRFPCMYTKTEQPFGIYIRLWPDPISENDGLTYAAGLYRSPTDGTGQNGLDAEYLSCARNQLAEMEHFNSFPNKATYNISFPSGSKLRAYLDEQNASAAAEASTAPSGPAQRVGESTNASGRFRTAGETISRLRFDQSHASIEYDIGYIDRFDGLVWTGLEGWQKATEEEDFVPEHRVKLIKRRGDDFVVWDREDRVDRT